MAKRIPVSLGTLLLAALIMVGCNRKPVSDTLPSDPASQPKETQVQTDPVETALISAEPTQMATLPQSTQPTNKAEGVEPWTEATSTNTTDPPQSSETTAATDPTNTTQETQSEDEVQQQTLTYEAYLQLSSAQQQEFFRSFDKVDEFYEWLDAARKAYEKEHPSVSGSGGIDIGDYIP